MGKETLDFKKETKKIEYKFDFSNEETANQLQKTLQAQKKIWQRIKDNPTQESLNTIVNR